MYIWCLCVHHVFARGKNCTYASTIGDNDRPEGMQHAYRLFFPGDKCNQMHACIYTYVCMHVYGMYIYICMLKYLIQLSSTISILGSARFSNARRQETIRHGSPSTATPSVVEGGHCFNSLHFPRILSSTPFKKHHLSPFWPMFSWCLRFGLKFTFSGFQAYPK